MTDAQKFANVNRAKDGDPVLLSSQPVGFPLHTPDSGSNEVNSGEEDQDGKISILNLICICLTSFFF